MASNSQNGHDEPPRFSFGDMALSDEPGRGSRPQSILPNEIVQLRNPAQADLNEGIDILRMISINEHFAPEVLPYQQEIIDGIRILVKQQADHLDAEEDETTDAIPFEAQLKRMEVDRLNYQLRQYFRVRLKKIENNILFIFKDEHTFDKLSDQEKEFAVQYSDLVEEHFKCSFLSMLPLKVQVLDKDGNVDHATGPNLNRFVFCRVRNNIGRVAVGEDASDDAFDLSRGDILCIRYKGIQELLRKEDVELV